MLYWHNDPHSTCCLHLCTACSVFGRNVRHVLGADTRTGSMYWRPEETILSNWQTTDVPHAHARDQTQDAVVESLCCTNWANRTAWSFKPFNDNKVVDDTESEDTSHLKQQWYKHDRLPAKLTHLQAVKMSVWGPSKICKYLICILTIQSLREKCSK